MKVKILIIMACVFLMFFFYEMGRINERKHLIKELEKTSFVYKEGRIKSKKDNIIAYYKNSVESDSMLVVSKLSRIPDLYFLNENYLFRIVKKNKDVFELVLENKEKESIKYFPYKFKTKKEAYDFSKFYIDEVSFLKN